ncbi:MAG: hypothetical protein IT326_06775, partial [Anaerolineae bacterium]|nr:hypothetical protein [Anaerolineae bacterium]
NKGGRKRCDFAHRAPDGTVRVYFGVTEDGVQESGHAPWRQFFGDEDED